MHSICFALFVARLCRFLIVFCLVVSACNLKSLDRRSNLTLCQFLLIRGLFLLFPIALYRVDFCRACEAQRRLFVWSSFQLELD